MHPLLPPLVFLGLAAIMWIFNKEELRLRLLKLLQQAKTKMYNRYSERGQTRVTPCLPDQTLIDYALRPSKATKETQEHFDQCRGCCSELIRLFNEELDECEKLSFARFTEGD